MIDFSMRMKYNLVDTVDKLKALDRILMDGDKAKFPVLAYDTETNGLPLYKTTVVGFSISFDHKTGYYIPLLKWTVDPNSKYTRTYKKVKYEAHKHGWLECIWTGEKFDEFVTPEVYNIKERFPLIPALMQRWLTSTNLYMWNAPFDVNHTFINTGVDLKNNLFLDGSLLVHALDENFSVGLKNNVDKYRHVFGINPHAHAASEKKELGESIIRNGGTPGQVWRADLKPQSDYGCADTFFTFGICEQATKDFAAEYGEKGLKWFFKQEVMPVCKEVVIDMKRKGAYIDVPYFQKIHDETQQKMYQLEDMLMKKFNEEGWLKDFDLGKSADEEVSNQAIVKHIIKLEGLEIPTTTNKKGEVKESIAKGVVKKEYAKNPHWIWAYILGEDEIKYNDDQMTAIKNELYAAKIGRRYRFNIGSGDHLRWLFCNKLGVDETKLPQTDAATKEDPKASMSAEVMEEHILPKFEWVSIYMSWKKLQKLLSTYISPALAMNINGWLYVDWKQNGTVSGRFSCSGGYNLQTLPRVDDELEALNECDKCGAERFDKDGKETGLILIKQDIECIADRECKSCGHIKPDIPRPSSIKKGFVAPPGYKIINADYSSLEPRCFAVMSGEEAIKDVYRNDLDLYSQVYCEIFDTEKQYSADPKAPNFLKKVAKAKRTWVKPIVLGIPYGAEKDQVAQLTGAMTPKLDYKTKKPILDDDGNVIMIPDTTEGQRVIDMYLGKFKNLHAYMDEQDFKAVTMGIVETIVGRKRHLPFVKKIVDVLNKYGVDYLDLKYAPSWTLKSALDVKYKSFRQVNVQLTEAMAREIQEAIGFKDEKFKEKGNWMFIRGMMKNDLNGAKNTPIQGLAGHITNKGMLDTTRAFKSNNIDGWVALQVHDEIGSYVKDTQSELGAKLLKNAMENNEFTQLLDINMVADPVICDNMKDAK